MCHRPACTRWLAIKSVIDVELFNREVAAEREEAAYLAAARKTVRDALRGLID